MIPSLATVTSLDVEATRAAERLGTPLFCYSLKALRSQIARLRNAVSAYPVQLLFATMANDRAEILRAIAGEGLGACVNSIPHLHQVLAHGFPAGRIQFTSCGLPVSDMSALQSLGISANLDSVSQIEAWCRLARGVEVGARINAAAVSHGSVPPDRIGMDLQDFQRARDAAAKLGGRVSGVHVYAGTNFQTPREMFPVLRGIFDLAHRVPNLDYVNLGGGIGIDYSHSDESFDYEGFGAEVCALAERTSASRGRSLAVFFEPGRSLVASSGLFITRVTDIKNLHGTRFVIVDASVSNFPRPYHQPGSHHHARLLGAPDTTPEETISFTIVGRTTFSRDILGGYHLPASLGIGALIAFEDAGAYCESMMSRFLGQREPANYISES